jgi:hypothetical protein
VRAWYGWQTAIVDGVAIGAGAVFAALPDPAGKLPPAARFGFTWWVASTFAEPVVHLAHHRAGIGFADFGMRTGVPLVAALVGAGVSCAATSVDDCSRRGAAYGLIGGTTLAAILDAALFAYDAPARAPTVPTSTPWTPAIAPATGGAFVSLRRAF